MFWRKNENKMKSFATGFAAFALLSGALAGCGGPSDSKTSATGGNSSKPIELRVAWWGSQVRHDLTLKVIKKFEELHPNIKVKPEYSGWDGYFDKLATEIAGNNAPDVMQMSVLYIKEYADRGSLLDLTPFENKELNTKDLDQDVLKNQGTVNGKLYGIALADNASVMMINKEMYKQAGVAAPALDWTWKDYFDKAREMKGKFGDKVYGASDMSASFEAFQYYLNAEGDTLFKGNALGYDDQNLKNWLQLWTSARKEGIVPPPDISSNYDGSDPTKDALIKGVVPVVGPSWTSVLSIYLGTMKDKVDMVPLPRDKKTGSVLETSMFLSGYGKTKHPKETAEFIDFFANNLDAADIMTTVRSGIPDNKKIREHLSPQFTEDAKNQIKMLDYVTSHDPQWYAAGPKGAAEVGDLFKKMVQKQQFGNIPIDQLVSQFRTEATKIIQKNN